MTPRTVPKSVGCGKSFTAHLQIKQPDKVRLRACLSCHVRNSAMSLTVPVRCAISRISAVFVGEAHDAAKLPFRSRMILQLADFQRRVGTHRSK